MIIGQPTTLPARPTAGTAGGGTVATAQPATQPTFAFTPQAGGPGTVVNVRGWNFVPGTPVKLRLGMPQPVGEVLASATSNASGLWSVQMIMPGALPSGELIMQSDLRVVVMNDADVPLASAAFGFTPVASGPQNMQPATDPTDAVQRFLAAAQTDDSGKTAAFYAGGTLLDILKSGQRDISGLIGQQNPYSAFSVDRIVATASPLTYVQVTLSYGSYPQPGATRIFTVREEYGTWHVTEISPAAADDPAVSPEEQARNDAAQFVERLSSGRYQEAGAFFAGDMQPLLDQNPDLSGDAVYNPELRGQLLERACTVNGYACLAQRRIIDTQRTGGDTFSIWMEFNNPDGSLHQLPDGTAALELRMQRIGGQFKVLNLISLS